MSDDPYDPVPFVVEEMSFSFEREPPLNALPGIILCLDAVRALLDEVQVCYETALIDHEDSLDPIHATMCSSG